MTLFERTKEISKKRGMSLQDAAKSAGIGINSIYQWKKQTPSVDRIKLVADVLNVSVDYLLGNTDDMHANKKADTSTPELIAAHWGIDLSELTDEEKGFVMGRAQDYVKGLVDAIEGRK